MSGASLHGKRRYLVLAPVSSNIYYIPHGDVELVIGGIESLGRGGKVQYNCGELLARRHWTAWDLKGMGWGWAWAPKSALRMRRFGEAVIIKAIGHVLGCMEQLAPGGRIDQLCQRQSSKMRPEVPTLEQTTWRSLGTWTSRFGAVMGIKVWVEFFLGDNYRLEALSYRSRKAENGEKSIFILKMGKVIARWYSWSDPLEMVLIISLYKISRIQKF